MITPFLLAPFASFSLNIFVHLPFRPNLVQSLGTAVTHRLVMTTLAIPRSPVSPLYT